MRDSLLDLRLDHLCWDGTEEILYESVRKDYAPDVDTIAGALRRAVRTSEGFASRGVYTATDLNWCLPEVAFVEKKPKPADVVVDIDGNRYTVLDADFNTLRSWWLCRTRNLTIANDLQDIISIETPVLSRDAALGLVYDWSIRYTGIKCRFQPITDDAAAERLVSATARMFRVIVDRQLQVTNDVGFDRINKDGVIYEILGYSNPERLDELPVLTVRQDP